MVEGGFVESRVMLSSSRLEAQMLYTFRGYSQFYRKRYGIAGEGANMDGEPGANAGEFEGCVLHYLHWPRLGGMNTPLDSTNGSTCLKCVSDDRMRRGDERSTREKSRCLGWS